MKTNNNLAETMLDIEVNLLKLGRVMNEAKQAAKSIRKADYDSLNESINRYNQNIDKINHYNKIIKRCNFAMWAMIGFGVTFAVISVLS